MGELAAGNNLTNGAAQLQEQPVVAWGEGDRRTTGHLQAALVGGEAHLPKINRLLMQERPLRKNLAGPKQMLTAQEQFFDKKWLDQIVLGTHFQAKNPIRRTTHPRQDQNRKRVAQLAQPSENILTGLFGQNLVKNQQIRATP